MSVATRRNGLRAVARKALQQLFEPLIGFVIDAGLSTNEMHTILRHAAVMSVATKQLEVSHRVNISGIAATTGIPRSEISRILKSSEKKSQHLIDSRQQSTNRVLAAWHEEPRFTNANGQPAELKIYGRGPTFETLVRMYGRGIPPRAVLDELIRTRAVEVISSQRIRARTALAVPLGMNAQVIKAFGDRAAELLSTMLANMREPENPRFVASVAGAPLVRKSLPLIRKELSKKSADFLAEIQESLSPEIGRRRGQSNLLSLTVFYHEANLRQNSNRNSVKKRQNFRRKT